MAVYRFKVTLFVSFLICANAFAQTKKAFDLNHQITISNTSVRLDSLLKAISRQTGFIFSYNTRKINPGLRFSFSNKRYSVDELLTKIKEKTGLDYSIADKHIILKSTRFAASPLKIQTTPTLLKEAKKENSKSLDIKSNSIIDTATSKVVVPEKKSELPTPIRTEVSEKPIEKVAEVVSDQKTQMLQVQKIQVEQSNPTPAKLRSLKKDSIVKVSNTNSKPVNPKIKKQSSFQVRTGLCADETLYLGPALQIGIPAFYGTVSYKTDFKIGLVSWGLGTSFKLSKTMNLNLQISTGNISKLYDSALLTSYDTATVHPGMAHRGLTARSSLTKVAFLIEKKISSRFVFQGGLAYNLFTTKYSEPPLNEDGKNLCAIKPPYLIANSTNAKGDTNVKSWIGLQLSLLYIIGFSKMR